MQAHIESRSALKHETEASDDAMVSVEFAPFCCIGSSDLRGLVLQYWSSMPSVRRVAGSNPILAAM